jgi:hypothetical protein
MFRQQAEPRGGVATEVSDGEPRVVTNYNASPGFASWRSCDGEKIFVTKHEQQYHRNQLRRIASPKISCIITMFSGLRGYSLVVKRLVANEKIGVRFSLSALGVSNEKEPRWALFRSSDDVWHHKINVLRFSALRCCATTCGNERASIRTKILRCISRFGQTSDPYPHKPV